MKVSVIVPAFNEKLYIEKCLESLEKQEDKPDEIIVVNNNSTDKTVAIAEKFPVRVVNEKEQGMIQARNRGFNEAQYDIIARIDADTMAPTDWIKKIKQSFQATELVALSGPSYFYETPYNLSPKTVFNLHKPYFMIIKEILRHDCLYGPNMAIRKSAWKKIKDLVCLNDKQVHEDIDLTIHLAPLGKIKFDRTLIVTSSFRRFKRFKPYLEYPYRARNSINQHEEYTLKSRSKKMIKKIIDHTFI
ncbi:glycosyltransferase family 2 protein [Candidatus Roizmanbacteria bacterium]|nr:glycosyltransferase family 2 protein [Candidatus Roizmanbacteria bacterium]